MALVRFAPELDPMGSLLALQSELERFLRNPGFSLGLSGSGAYPPINIFEDAGELVIIAEVPGLDPAAVQVSGQGRTLTISSERRPVETGGSAAYHRRERAFGQFSRPIQMPDGLDLAKASATYEAGLLTIRLPKSEAAKPRQINVQSA
jgi:HSP20 family protein